MPEIKNVLFDFGGVLVNWNWRIPFQGYYTPAQMEELKTQGGLMEFIKRQDVGADFEEELSLHQSVHHNPKWVEMIRHYYQHFDKTVAEGPVEGMKELVTKLIELGIKPYGLSNWSIPTFQHGLAHDSAIHLLYAYIVSADVRLVKPDHRIFELTAERFNLDPSKTLFVDDLKSNTEAARGCGYRAHTFTDAKTLREDLKNTYGLNL
jgi:2-haloacid dehalogenase